MQKILFVEDQPDFQASVRLILEEDYEIHIACNAEEGYGWLLRTNFSLILLDVQLPDENGFSLFEKIRADERFRRIPVIFLTAKDGVGDRVKGFTSGALDYIVKPFEPLEFKARIDAHMARAAESAAVSGVETFGVLTLDRAKKCCLIVAKSGLAEELELTPYEFEILLHLARREGEVVPRDVLMREIWNDVNVLSRTVDRHVSSLRKKLHGKYAFLEGVHGQGYRIKIMPPELLK